MLAAFFDKSLEVVGIDFFFKRGNILFKGFDDTDQFRAVRGHAAETFNVLAVKLVVLNTVKAYAVIARNSEELTGAHAALSHEKISRVFAYRLVRERAEHGGVQKPFRALEGNEIELVISNK